MGRCVFALVLVFILALSTVVLAEEGSEETFLTKVRALTYEGKRSGEGYFSPDGRHFIFQSERDEENPFYQIYIMSLEDGSTHRVSPGTGKTTCAYFRPGTNEVLFASTHLDPDAVNKQQAEIDFRNSGKSRRYSWDYDSHYDIFAGDRSGEGNFTRLTDAPGYDAEGSYSPDGGQIVFCSTRGAYPLEDLSDELQKRYEMDAAYFGDLFIMDADGGNVRRLTDEPGYDGGPFFSPDGASIVWRHFDESGALADIFTMHTDGTGRVQVTDFESMCWAPYYHPTGEYIIFTTNKLGFSNFELYIVDSAGEREPVRVTYTDGFDGLPVFSPDGGRLAWTSNRAGDKSQIYMAEWNHTAALAALAASPRRAGARAGASVIAAGDMKTDVTYLASDELDGRMTGTEGTKKAAAYIKSRFESLAIAPAGEDGYFQEFPFTAGVRVNNKECALEVTADGDTREFKVDKHFRPLGFSDNDEVEGSVVFAGYGLTMPGDMGEGYDSYSGLDVKDKIVLVLRYVPEDVEMDRREQLNVYAGLRYKAMLARDQGAKALLVVTGPNSPNAGELVPLRHDQSTAGSGIVVASITDDVAKRIMKAAGKDLEEIQSQLDVENPHFEAHFEIPEVTVRLKASLHHEKKTGRNVIGVIEPGGDGEPEYVLIGAHYDHIGHGEIGSLAHKGEEGQIHNGADDNASGTAVVLELAGALADIRGRNPELFRRGVVIALWSGEELGIIGSNHFAANPTRPAESIVAYLNFDMVGRLRDNKLMVQGVGSSAEWTGMVERRNVAAGFNLVLQEDPYLPTDVTSFYPKGVPVLSFFTGSHEDYNRPTDDAETLDYDGMERIASLAFALVGDLVSAEASPEYAKVERSKQDMGGRGSLRAYLGTIPDYATEGTEGVKLSGVRAGGPADKAGLRGGDIIVEFAGRKIVNIYDYTYALDAVKIGEPVVVVVLRDDQRVTLEVVPEARK